MNAESRQTFYKRSQIIREIRNFLAGREFMEVETPMLVANADHAWSAVAETDGWHMYDITFYDNNNLSKCPQYLDMDTATMNDGFHSNITTLLAGYSENTYASK